MPSSGSGTIRPLYGVVIRDKCKSADVETLKAYKIVAEDLLKGHKGPDAKDLADAIKELDQAIAAKHGKKRSRQESTASEGARTTKGAVAAASRRAPNRGEPQDSA